MILAGNIKDMVDNLSPKQNIKTASAKPIVGPPLLEIPDYKIEFVFGNKDKSYRKINMMEVRPIELDAAILFYNKRNKKGPLLPISLISDIKRISHYKGVFNKKERSLVEISFYNQDKEKKTIRINIAENKIDKFLQQIKEIQNKLEDKKSFSTSYILNFRSESGEVASSVELFPGMPFLSQGEEIYWKNIKKKGLENKPKVDHIDLITNYRIFQYSYIDHNGKFILINQIKDILIDNLNQSSAELDIKNIEGKVDQIDSNKITENNKDITADITITSDERSTIIFKGISDPNRVIDIIKSLRKQCNFSPGEIMLPVQLNETLTESKRNTNNDNSDNNKYKEKFKQVLSVQNSLVCSNCKKINTANSNFCNKCGFKLNIAKKCIKCGYPNQNDAVFCNICGNKL